VFEAEEIQRLQIEYERLTAMQNKLYEDRLAGIVDDIFWKRKHEELVNRQGRVLRDLERHKSAKTGYVMDGTKILKLAQEAYSLFVTRDPFEQRELVDLLLSNCTLKGGVLSYELRKPFDLIADGVEKQRQLRHAKLPSNAVRSIWLVNRVAPPSDSDRPATVVEHSVLQLTELMRGVMEACP
jgi:hypothetical protein